MTLGLVLILLIATVCKDDLASAAGKDDVSITCIKLAALSKQAS